LATPGKISTWKKKDSGGIIYVKLPGETNWRSSGMYDRRDAIEWAQQVQRGGLGPDITVRDFCTGFFDPGKWDYVTSRPDRGKAYWKALQHDLDDYVIPRWGNWRMRDVGPADFHGWLLNLVSVRSIELKKPRQLSARSKGSILSTAKVVWRWATFKTNGAVPNVLDVVPGIEGPEKKRRAFRFAELQKLFPSDLSQVWPEPWGLFFFLAAETGNRPQEVCGLDVEGFRPDRKAYIITRAVDSDGELAGLKTEGKGIDKKAVPLSDRLTDLLKVHIGDRKTGLVFSRLEEQKDGTKKPVPLRVDTAEKVFAKTIDKEPAIVDRQGRTPYCLRHTANTRMRTQLGDELARAVMGHVTPEMTRRYDDPDEEDLLIRIGRGSSEPT
jgi:integrase